MSSFADLGVTRPVVDALTKRGMTAPFAVQDLVIGDVLDGSDVLVQSPTGSGKTLAFGVPLAECIEPDDLMPAALILAPTRELALQIEEEIAPLAAARKLRVAAVFGGVALEKQARDAARAHIIVATPGRLEDLLNRRTFDLGELRILVIDEADRMLDMGFRPAVDRIVNQTPGDRQTLFFSATLEAAAGELARAYTNDPARHVHEPVEADRGEVAHRFVHLDQAGKVEALVTELRAADSGRTLVFVRTKHGADRLVKRLAKHRVDAVAMHGNKTQNQRNRALARFAAGQVDTLVATDVAARGIDVDDITHVINYDAPGDSDAYVHRVGRTARAGRDGTGVTFVSSEQDAEMRKIARGLGLVDEYDHGRPAHAQRAHNGGSPAASSRRSRAGGGRSRGRSGGPRRSR